MSASLNRAAARGRLHRIALAGLVSFAMIATGGFAAAQESEDPATVELNAELQITESSETEEPAPPQEPEIVVVTGCFEPEEGDKAFGSVDVDITNPNDTKVLYKITLKTNPEMTDEIEIAGGDTDGVTFDGVPGGVFDVLVTGSDGTTGSSEADLDRCEEITVPVESEMQVFVRCEAGEGLVTIRLFNLGRPTRTLTVELDDVELGEPIELEGGTYILYIDEESFADGTYEFKVFELNEAGAPKLLDTETVTVACAPPSSPSTPPTNTQPPPQGGTPPSGDLPTTGVAIRGVAVLGLIALVLGAALVFVGRRRRTTPEA